MRYLLGLFLTGSLWAAPTATLLNPGGTRASSTSITATFSATADTDDIVVAFRFVDANGADPSSVTDSASSAYTKTSACRADHSAYTGWECIYHSHPGTAITSVTVSWSGTQASQMYVWSITELAASPIDKGVWNQAISGPNWTSTATATTSQASEVAIGFAADRNSATQVFTITGSGTWSGQDSYQDGTDSVTITTAYQILSATGTPSFAGTLGTSAYTRAMLATFKVAGGAPPTVTRRRAIW